MNLWEIIFLFFACQAFLLSIFFFLKNKGDKVANRILGVYLFLFSFNLSYNVLYWSKQLYQEKYIHLFGTLAVIWISYPILIYLYTRRVLEKSKFQFKDLIHFTPILVIALFYARFYILSASEKFEALVNGTLSDYIFNINHNLGLTLLVMVFYVFLIYFTIKKNILSLNKKRWLKWLLGSFACYVFAMIAYYVLSRLGLITTGHDYFITYTLILFIGLVSYFGFVQPNVFDGLSMDKVLPFKKYKSTGLTETHSLELKSKLIDLMKAEKPHLDTTLRLDDLANKLNLSRHHMSQIINEHFDVNFFDFINGYRIEEARDLILSESNLNITDIIYSSGFNNRVSFYKAFKKHTKMTPTQFKALQQ